MSIDRSCIRRVEGYMGNPFQGLLSKTNEAGEIEYPVTFWTYNPQLTVYMAEAVLAAAGITPENGRIVVADIRKDATVPTEVDPINLEDGGVLPSLDEEFHWLQPKTR